MAFGFNFLMIRAQYFFSEKLTLFELFFEFVSMCAVMSEAVYRYLAEYAVDAYGNETMVCRLKQEYWFFYLTRILAWSPKLRRWLT